MYEIHDFLDLPTLSAFQEIATRDEHFLSGESTAGWHARDQKRNLQAKQSGLVTGLLRKVEQSVMSNDIINAAARPKNVIKMVLNRYGPGMFYGSHMDDALMNGQRTDLSFTLFLSAPSDYDGGELVIDEAGGERHIKLEAGSLFLYPSSSLHRVEEVSRGTRIAVAGWIRSYIRDPFQREILFDLERAIHALRSGDVDNQGALPSLLKTRSNLLRLWSED